jgi:hypothetical protein
MDNDIKYKEALNEILIFIKDNENLHVNTKKDRILNFHYGYMTALQDIRTMIGNRMEEKL